MQHAPTDPSAALDAWLSLSGPEPGPLFTSMRSKVATLELISGEAVSIVLCKCARTAGAPPRPAQAPPTLQGLLVHHAAPAVAASYEFARDRWHLRAGSVRYR